MHAAPGAVSQSVKIIIVGAEVKQTNKFCYSGIVLSSVTMPSSMMRFSVAFSKLPPHSDLCSSVCGGVMA